MGVIRIEEMEFYAYHGHYQEEQIVGNKFLVDLEMHTDTEKAAQTDNLKDALNYQVAYKLVKKEMDSASHLLEHIGGRILDALYKEFGDALEKCSVKVSKMNPPMGGKMNCVSVTVER